MKKFLVSILLVFSLVALAAPAMAGAEARVVVRSKRCERCGQVITVRSNNWDRAELEADILLRKEMDKHKVTCGKDL